MPGYKPTGKPACQLLFLEALAQHWPVPVTTVPPMTDPPETMQSPKSDFSMECILQEITAVGRRLEDMGTKISDLAAESMSIHNDIASFQNRVTIIDHRLSLVEDKLNSSCNSDHVPQGQNHGPRGDRDPRDNVCFFGIPERAEAAARSHGPHRYTDRELRMAPDFSRDTKERQREFLKLSPQCRQLDMKFGLFEPASMMVTKGGKSKDFLDPITPIPR
ncbi:hypothetical protein NDU88_001532 [Pleurodeles waltl]|uniref:Uncharacterized protein n=1 Tax=Pleurodeles waltl TaxID=8319 RepID=A0AAV7V9X5_PLEWA|nr:hypothetical protein NDU88_001532 [Pleurodeles waltl]